MTRLNKTNLTQALRESKGAVSIAAKRLGVSRRAIYKRLDQWPDVKEVLEDVRSEVCDLAELKLYAMINDETHKDQLKAIMYQLDTHGRDRGWGAARESKIELTGRDGGPMETRASIDVSELSTEALAEIVAAKRRRDD